MPFFVAVRPEPFGSLLALSLWKGEWRAQNMHVEGRVANCEMVSIDPNKVE